MVTMTSKKCRNAKKAKQFLLEVMAGPSPAVEPRSLGLQLASLQKVLVQPHPSNAAVNEYAVRRSGALCGLAQVQMSARPVALDGGRPYEELSINVTLKQSPDAASSHPGADGHSNRRLRKTVLGVTKANRQQTLNCGRARRRAGR